MAPPIAARQRRLVSLSTLLLTAALVMPAAVGAQDGETNGVATGDEVAIASEKVIRQVQGKSRQKRVAGPKARCQPFQNGVTYKRGGAPGKGVVRRDFGGGNGDRGELIFSDAGTGTGLFWTDDPGYVSIQIAALGGDGAAPLDGLLFEGPPGSMPRGELLDQLAERSNIAGATQEQLFADFDEQARASDGGCLWTTRFTPRKADRDQLVPFWEAIVGVPPAEPAVNDEGRFRIEVAWQDLEGVEQTATQSFDAIASTDEMPGYFFDVADASLLVKLVDACAEDNHFWVFASATTGLEFELTVTDTASAQTRTYQNPLAAEPAITDTSAFATCP